MPVPDLHYSTFLGSVFELSVGEGRLLVCGYAIEDPQGPAAVALRNSLLAYAAGESFKPSAKADFEWLSARFRPVWRDRLAPRPAEFREAPVYIECAVGMPSNGGMRWMRGYDRAELAKGTYRFDGKGTGIWKDGTGTFWYGRRIDFTLKDIPPTAGELRVRFRDPNRNGRTGRGVFEGAAFEIPAHQDNPDGAYWLRLPLLREQALDGRLEFSCEALTGPNLMIDRIVVIPADAASAAASAEPPRLRLPRKAEQELAYLKPACDWNHALPVGNGRLGGMVFGGVGKETVQLNEDTIWTGSPNELTVKGFREALPEARRLLFAGDFAKGQAKLPGYPYTQKYQPFGSLEISRADSAVTDYERTLDLDRAVATVTYVQDGVTFTEEVISSLADGVLVVRLAADRPGRISFRAALTTPHANATRTFDGGAYVVRGVPAANRGIPSTIRFEGRLEVRAEGGRVTTGDDGLSVEGADEAVLFVNVATSFENYRSVNADESKRCKAPLAAVRAKPYAAILADHVAKYRAQADRCKVFLGADPRPGTPTDERLRLFKEKGDAYLAALYFRFGRYLMISSSQPGTQPTNLQGIWNDLMSPPWQCNYTININTEMNYWPAEVTALPECAEPLYGMLKDLSVTGAKVARECWGAEGWCAHHNVDIWRTACPCGPVAAARRLRAARGSRRNSRPTGNSPATRRSSGNGIPSSRALRSSFARRSSRTRTRNA